MQIFRPAQLVVLAAIDKNLDRGSSSTGRAVKILSFFGAFIIGLLNGLGKWHYDN